MDELAALSAIPTDATRVKSETRARVPADYDVVFDRVLDGCLDANRIAMHIRSIAQRRRNLITKLDDPANADDPRRGEAEAKAFQLKVERDDLIAQFVGRCTWIDARAAELSGDEYAQLVVDISYSVHPSSLIYLVQRIKETRCLPFFVLVLVQDVDSSNGDAPF